MQPIPAVKTNYFCKNTTNLTQMSTLCYNSTMSTTITHANIYTPDEILPDHSIEIENGIIKDLHPTGNSEPESKNDVINAPGMLVTPGLIDIHIHGNMGADSMDAPPTAYDTISTYLCEHGVTAFLATTVTSSETAIESALEMIEQSKNRLAGAHLLGAHVEGPYINIAYKGAQNPAYFHTPQKEEYETWAKTGVVKLITIAPELEGMDEFIRYCVNQQIELAIGHSQATYEQVLHAANLGVRQATHLFNGMLGLHHREPGTVGGVLADKRIYAQIIVDGVHLHPAIVKLVIQIKGIERTILISDAMRATGLDNGKYDLGGQEVSVTDGVARIANGALAGSTLTLDKAIRNTMEFTGLEFQQVLPMATRVPAQALHVADRKGAIKAGYDADITFFTPNHEVAASMVAGKMVYNKNL